MKEDQRKLLVIHELMDNHEWKKWHVLSTYASAGCAEVPLQLSSRKPLRKPTVGDAVAGITILP